MYRFIESAMGIVEEVRGVAVVAKIRCKFSIDCAGCGARAKIYA
jgi:hypothetical protein